MNSERPNEGRIGHPIYASNIVLMSIFDKGPNSKRNPTIREMRKKRGAKWYKKREVTSLVG